MGFLTSTLPALRRFIIHSEWKAGMSVRRLAQIIIPPRNTDDYVKPTLIPYKCTEAIGRVYTPCGE